MIEAWFNERGFRIETEKGVSKFVYDLPPEIIDNAAHLYTSRWMVLNQMMDQINELSETIADRDLVLYTDGRLLEELQGELTPDTQFGQASQRFFIERDYVRFRRVSFRKCASTVIYGKLSEPLDTEGFEAT